MKFETMKYEATNKLYNVCTCILKPIYINKFETSSCFHNIYWILKKINLFQS